MLNIQYWLKALVFFFYSAVLKFYIVSADFSYANHNIVNVGFQNLECEIKTESEEYNRLPERVGIKHEHDSAPVYSGPTINEVSEVNIIYYLFTHSLLATASF